MKIKLVAVMLGWLGWQAMGTVQAAPAPDRDPATMIISTAHPLSVKDKKLRQAVFDYCQQVLNAPAGQVGAHPSAAVFPGLVAVGTPRLSKTVTIRHTPPEAAMLRLITPLDYSDQFAPTMYSTGLYAAPGEVVTVNVPAAMAGQLTVQIGCHSDSLNEDEAAT